MKYIYIIFIEKSQISKVNIKFYLKSYFDSYETCKTNFWELLPEFKIFHVYKPPVKCKNSIVNVVSTEYIA